MLNLLLCYLLEGIVLIGLLEKSQELLLLAGVLDECLLSHIHFEGYSARR